MCLRNSKLPSFAEYTAVRCTEESLEDKGQKKLSHSQIAVVGLGGLGTVSSLISRAWQESDTCGSLTKTSSNPQTFTDRFCTHLTT